jgi:AcrR family transcriptional regulator
MTVSDPSRSSRRQEIQAIAAELFAVGGFANVTVDHIGEAAGVSGPALYHHFAGKEALLGEMLVDISTRLLDGGRRIRETTHDPLPALVRFHCEFAVDDRALITVHFRDLIHATPDDQRRVRHLQSRYVAIWVEALVHRWPTITPRVSRAAIHAAFGLVNSTPFSATLPRHEMITMLEQMALAALDSVAEQSLTVRRVSADSKRRPAHDSN